MTTTASINSKGTNDTGITDDLVKSLHDNLGKSIVAVVEIRSESRVENLKGDEKVNLVIQTLEPALTADAEEHLRSLQRSLNRKRKLNSEDEQLQIDTLDDVEPTVEQVIAAGQDHVAHTDDELVLDQPDDPENPDEPALDVAGDDQAEPETDDQGDEPWEYDATEGDNVTTLPDPFAATSST